MDLVTEPERWAGMLVAFGVLLPMTLWFAARGVGGRTHGLVNVLSAVFLLYAVGSAVGRTSIVGLLISYRDFGPPGDADYDVSHSTLLLLGGGLAGLAVATLLRGRPDEPADGVAAGDDAVAGEGDEPPAEDLPPIAGRTEVLGDEPADAHWSTRLVEREPRRVTEEATMASAVPALILTALALSLPLSGFGLVFSADYALSRLVEPNAWDVASLVSDGLLPGFALLFAALAVRARDVPVVGLAFLLVAAGQGAATAFPETFDNHTWYMVGTGLVVALLLPSALRLLGRAVTRDAWAVAGGVLLALATIAASSALDSQARRTDDDTSFGSSVGG